MIAMGFFNSKGCVTILSNDALLNKVLLRQTYLSNLAGTKSQGPHLSFRVLPSTCLRNIWKAKTKHGYHFSYAVKSRRGLTDSFRDQVADFRVFSQQKREYWVTGKMMRRKTMIPSTSIVKMPLLRLCFCSKGNLTIICNDNRGYGLFYATAEPEMRTQMSALPLTAGGLLKEKSLNNSLWWCPEYIGKFCQVLNCVEVLHADALILLLHFWEKR